MEDDWSSELNREFEEGMLASEFQDWLNAHIESDEPPVVDVGALISIIWMVIARLRLILTRKEMMAVMMAGIARMESAIVYGTGFTDPKTGEPIFTMLAEEAEALGYANGMAVEPVPDTLEGFDEADQR